jgi:tetratricopeptide (TPR) repeat protein
MTSHRVGILFLILLAHCSTAQSSSLTPTDDVHNLIATNQFDAAEKLVVARLVEHPQDADLITDLAEIRLSQGRAAEALRLASDAERVGGATALRAQISGLAESASGHLTPAETQFRQAIQLDPKFVPAHYFLARLLYTRNRFDEAIQESKKTIALSPDFVRAYENLGLCYEGKDDPKQAEPWYREAIERNSQSPNKTEWPMLDYATLLVREDRIQEARPYLEQAISVNPRNAQSHFQMGILLEKAGDPKGSLEQLRNALQLDPKLPGALYRAARVCKKLGREQESEQYFDEYKKVTEKKQQ